MSPPRPEASIHGADAIVEPLEAAQRIAGPDARRLVAWATVELDRAEHDSAAGRSRDLPDDPHLGARCRLVTGGPPDGELLFVEPSTEGRLAASLARFGEGRVAVYLLVPAGRLDDVTGALVRAGLALSVESPGPFGRQRLVAGGPPWGAHLLIAEDAPIPARPGAATIGR